MSDRDMVLAWVRRAPFDDIKLMAAEPDFSYERWFRQGKELAHGVDILTALLSEEDLNHPSADGMRIAYALGWIGDQRPTVTEALVRAIRSKDVTLRIEAVSALGRLRAVSVTPLLEKLLGDQNEEINVRGNACVALGRIGNRNSLGLLQHAAQSEDGFISAAGKEALRLYSEAQAHPVRSQDR